ncbi:MAG TPA: hypothetical protein VGM47_01275 [Gammaproteobacteria bacterium]|jgi:hypothetical protein
MSTLLRHPLAACALSCAVPSLAVTGPDAAQPAAPAAMVAAPAAATDVPQVLQLGTVMVSGGR